MSRSLIWTPAARHHLEDIWRYIARYDEPAAKALISKVKLSCEKLANLSEIGRPGHVEGTRELIISGTPYIVPYRVRDNAVEIIAVFHGSRKWPESF